MVLIENITDVSFNSNKNGNLNFIVSFYYNYFNEFKIKKNIFTKINNTKSPSNKLNIFNIKFDNIYIQIFHDDKYYNIKELLIQKQEKQIDEEFINFNLFALKLEENGIIDWFTIFDLGTVYNKIKIENGYFNNKNLISRKKNHTRYKIYSDFVQPQKNQTTDISINSVINIINRKEILLPYSNNSFSDEKLSLQFYALINPIPKLKINVDLQNNNSQLLMFNNFTSINIQEYKNDNFDNIFKNNGFILKIKPLRISDIGGEIIKFEIIADTGYESTNLYNLSYSDVNNNLDVRVNVFSFEFVNNYSRDYFGNLNGAKIQDKNKIIINTKTNSDIIIENDNIKPEIFRPIVDIKGIGNDGNGHGYFKLTSDIITNKKRPIITGCSNLEKYTENYNNGEIIRILINKDDDLKNAYDASFNILDISNNEIGNWTFNTRDYPDIVDDTFYIDTSSNNIELQIFDTSKNYYDDSGNPQGIIKFKLNIDLDHIEGYDISFQKIYNKGKEGQDNHMKIKMLGLTSEIFDDFGLENSKIGFMFENNFSYNISLIVRNAYNDDFSGNFILSNDLDKDSGVFILKKALLFGDQSDISGSILELYVKTLDLNEEYLKFNNSSGSIATNTTSTNDLFNNIIIDDINVFITGINNSNRLLININNDVYKYSNETLFQSLYDSFFHRLEFRPLPLVKVNRDISENLYYNVTTNISLEGDNNFFMFERLNFFDQSINKDNMEEITIGYKVLPTGLLDYELSLNNYGTTTDERDISFNVTEDNIYIFNMSDESNKGSRLRFFSDIGCKNELYKNYDNDFEYDEKLFNDYETLAEYSENIDPGYPGAYVKLKIPKYIEVKTVNDGDKKKIYYANKFKYKQGNYPSGIIYINVKNDILIKQPTVLPIDNNSNGELRYNHPDYEIFSTLYEENEDITGWKDLSFNLKSEFISKIQPDISYNYNNDGTTKGKLSIYNKGQWYGKQTFIATDASFNISDNTITKFIFKHNLKNAILNISFIDCSNNYPNQDDFVNPVFTNYGDLSLNKLLDYSGAGDYRDISYNDLSYNYYGILKNDICGNRTSFFEKYNVDYSGNIYLLGAVIDEKLNLCQVKLKNQHYERTDFEPQYKINFEDISGTKKIITHSTAYALDEIKTRYNAGGDICHNIQCTDIYINKFYNPSGTGVNRFKDLNVVSTLNLIFTDDKILYGFGRDNKTSDEEKGDESDYKIIGDTNDSHKLFIIVDSDGKIFFGDDDDKYIYLTSLDNKITSKNTQKNANFKLVFSLQDISGNDNADHNDYKITLADYYEYDIKHILIRRIGGLSGEITTSIPMETYQYTDISDSFDTTYHITGVANGENVFKSGDFFDETTGDYLGLSGEDPSYNDLSNNEMWYDISGITFSPINNTVDKDKHDLYDPSGGKHGYWFMVDLSTNQYVDQISITGTEEDMSANPKSFYVYGKEYDVGNKTDPSSNTGWTLLNRFSYVENFYNYEITEKEYKLNNYTITRGLKINQKQFRFYRLLIFKNFGSKYIKIKNIKLFKNSVIMKNYARENINFSRHFLNTEQYRNSKSVSELFTETTDSFILDHSLLYDKNLSANEGKKIQDFSFFDEDGKFTGLKNDGNVNAIEDIFTNTDNKVTIGGIPHFFHKTTYGDTTGDISGITITFEVKDASDILQSISINGLKKSIADSTTNIIVNDISANIKELYLFGKKKPPPITDIRGVASATSATDADANYKEKYEDEGWDYICDLSYNINEFINSTDGIVKRWVNNVNNFDKSFKYYRIVITKNFGAKYVYFNNISLERSNNIIDRRVSKLEITDISYVTISEKPNIVPTGFFDITPNIREITLNNTDEIINKNRPYDDISLNKITVHLCDINNCHSVRANIYGIRKVLISWEFDCSNVYVDINFNIYRMQNSTDPEITKKKILIGITKNKYLWDNGPIPYLMATYYVEPVITWQNETIMLAGDNVTKFICQSNRFPDGRYNVRSDNPKLFSFVNGNSSHNLVLNEKIKTGSTCGKNQMSSNPKTSILFKNTNVMTKKEIYSMLSRGATRPFR